LRSIFAPKRTKVKKNRKWLILLIVAFPSLFWLILESSTINSSKLPHYGPKKTTVNGDTVFYEVGDELLSKIGPLPAYTAVFIKPSYKSEAYRVAGLWEYITYKRSKLGVIPFVIVTTDSLAQNDTAFARLRKTPNLFVAGLPEAEFNTTNARYFKHKPYYVDYSFIVLVDGNRNIRGYYDGRLVVEVKRLIDEYRHLRLKDEKQKMINENEVRSNN
jgi:hypothetical protein